MPDTFNCTLVTPQSQMLDEAVTYASIPAWDGQIGIAPRRAPLLVKLGPGSLRLDFTAGGSRWFFLGGSFAQMRDDALSLLTDEAIGAEEIVLQDAEATLKQAQGMSATTTEQVEQKRNQVNRARALLQLANTLDNKV